MENMMEEKLHDIAYLVGIYERCSLLEMQPHLHQLIVLSLNSFLREFTDSPQVAESQSPRKTAGDVVAELHRKKAVEKTLEEADEKAKSKVEEAQPEPKRRERKKKEVVKEEPKEEEQATIHREIVFEKGLDKELASFSTIEGVDDDKIVNENLGPIPLANSLPKQGEHPFYKGPAQFVWYLPVERWSLYLADLLESEKFYPDQLSLYDTERLEEAKRVGVDIEFVGAIVDKESKRMISIEDFAEKDYADDDASLEKVNELKENGFLKDFVEKVDPNKTLLKFLTRFGWNKGIIDDLETIYEEHTQHPNKYIHW